MSTYWENYAAGVAAGSLFFVGRWVISDVGMPPYVTGILVGLVWGVVSAWARSRSTEPGDGRGGSWRDYRV